MKVKYRDYEIEVIREECMAGYELLYYYIFRIADGYECTSGFSEEDITVREMVSNCKERVDNELLDDNPWGEFNE